MSFSKSILQLLQCGRRRAWNAVCSDLFKSGQWWLCELFFAAVSKLTCQSQITGSNIYFLNLMVDSMLHCRCNRMCLVTLISTVVSRESFLTVSAMFSLWSLYLPRTPQRVNVNLAVSVQVAYLMMAKVPVWKSINVHVSMMDIFMPLEHKFLTSATPGMTLFLIII